MPESEQRQRIEEEARRLLDEYAPGLAASGVKLALSKRYFESKVGKPTASSPDPGVRLLLDIDRWFAKRRERKYRNARNQYHCLILTVLPLDEKSARKECCRDYSFCFRKNERSRIGQKPKSVEEKSPAVISKIEKRIRKIYETARKHGAQRAWEDRFPEALRYCFGVRYAYKKRILGKMRAFWDLIFALMIVGLAAALCFAAWIAGR